MSEEIRRDKFPSSGGWLYRQPQFGDWKNPMALVGFDASVKAIQQARQRNRALSAKHNLSTDYEAIAAELIEYNRLIRGISPPATSFFQPSRNRRPGGAPVAAGSSWFRRLSQLGTGIATISDLKRSGRDPVLNDVAERRAAVCVGCPKNLPGDLLSIFTKPIANLVRAQIEDKTKLKLQTTLDDKLGVCDACGCPMKLKIWFGIDVILAHIKKPEYDSLDPRCWILKEQQSSGTPTPSV